MIEHELNYLHHLGHTIYLHAEKMKTMNTVYNLKRPKRFSRLTSIRNVKSRIFVIDVQEPVNVHEKNGKAGQFKKDLL